MVGVCAPATCFSAERFQATSHRDFGLIQELAKLHLFILIVVGHLGVADQVGDTCGWNRSLKLIRLRDEPIRELASVAHAFYAHALAVNPQVAAHGRA